MPVSWDDLKDDMRTVGHVIYTLLYGVEPFKNSDDVIMFSKIMYGAQFPEVLQACSGAQDLCRRLLSLDPKFRPQRKRLFKNLDFESNYMKRKRRKNSFRPVR